MTRKGAHKKCHNGHTYTEANTRLVVKAGRTCQRCLICEEWRNKRQNRRRYGAPRDPALCKKGLHKITTETAYERPDGSFGCLLCRRKRAREYVRTLNASRYNCIVSGCVKHTNRQHAKLDEPYVCPAHRKDPPDETVTLLRKLGKLHVLDRIPAPRRAA